MQNIQVIITEIEELNPMIRRLALSPCDSHALHHFTAGAHIRVQVSLPTGEADWRHYSLINLSTEANNRLAPKQYDIAVLREDGGKGGSRFMHSLKLTIQIPENNFPMVQSAGKKILIAGGIGVTPLISMAAESKAKNDSSVSMVYAGRTRELMAFLPELQKLLGNSLTIHADAEVGSRLNMASLLDNYAAIDHFYICGPQAMLDSFLAAYDARNLSRENIHFELFSAPQASQGDHAFEVVLAQSGKTYQVSSQQTILDCLIDKGCDPLFDCKRGECGVCAVPVIEGEIDHRDYVLSKDERLQGNVIQICISRAKNGRLILDI
jgi:ferredoxin-NADP reductase